MNEPMTVSILKSRTLRGSAPCCVLETDGMPDAALFEASCALSELAAQDVDLYRNDIVEATRRNKVAQECIGTVVNMLYTPPAPVTGCSDVCTWKPDEEDCWETTCGNRHVFFDGTPHQNGYAFCPYCGKQLAQTEGEDSD